MNVDILLGKTTEHLVPIEGTKCLIHKQMLQDFLRLQKDAREAGFDLQIISAFRDYERQALIWNKKARGERTLLDDHGIALNFHTLPHQGLALIIPECTNNLQIKSSFAGVFLKTQKIL